MADEMADGDVDLHASTRHCFSGCILRLRCVASWMAAVFFVVAIAGIAAPSVAVAQERVERRSIIDMLFGPSPRQAVQQPPPQAAPDRPQAPAAQPRRSGSGQSSGSARRASAPPPPPAVEKAEDAARILVIGDFMASGLAEGLQAAFAENPDVVVTPRANGSSGLVRDDYYDWPGSLPAMLDELEPDITVIMLGSNDRQQLRVEQRNVDVHSEAWKAEYARRVRALAAIVAEKSVPLIWVGAPAFQSPRMSADILEINTIYRDQMTQAGGEFVDIWDGFVDESGAFVFTGSDIQGQQVRLRGSDGINMTAAGKRKLAFYAEKPIRRYLEAGEAIGADPLLSGLLPADALAEDADEESRRIVRTPPIAINDPAFDGGDALLGAQPSPVSAVMNSPREALVEEGLSAKAPFGRADYFRWPRQKPEEDDPDDPDTTASVEEVTATGTGEPPQEPTATR